MTDNTSPAESWTPMEGIVSLPASWRPMEDLGISLPAIQHVALSTDSSQPVENLPMRRVLVVGSPSWPLSMRAAAAQVILDWWLIEDRPLFQYVIANDDFGRMISETLSEDYALPELFTYENLRNPVKEIQRRMLDGLIHRAFVFRIGDDRVARQWIDELRERQLPTTILGYDIITNPKENPDA